MSDDNGFVACGYCHARFRSPGHLHDHYDRARALADVNIDLEEHDGVSPYAVEIPPDGDLIRAAIGLDTVVSMSGTFGTMPDAAVVIMADMFNRERDGERPEIHQRLLATRLHDPGDTLAEICANNLRIVGPEPVE